MFSNRNKKYFLCVFNLLAELHRKIHESLEGLKKRLTAVSFDRNMANAILYFLNVYITDIKLKMFCLIFVSFNLFSLFAHQSIMNSRYGSTKKAC